LQFFHLLSIYVCFSLLCSFISLSLISRLSTVKIDIFENELSHPEDFSPLLRGG
jgi:hypothetical protein